MTPSTPPRSPAIPALLLIVALFAVGALIVAVAQDPVDAGTVTVCPEGSQEGRLEVDGRTACTRSNLNGTEVTFGVAIHNAGWLPMTVSEVPLAPLDLVGFTPTGASVATPENDLVLEEFSAFGLQPGEERLVQVNGELPRCEDRTDAGATTFTDLAVQVRVLGIPRTVAVPLDPAIRLLSETC